MFEQVEKNERMRTESRDLSFGHHLDRYLIVEPNETWQIFNWMLHYTPESLQAELRHAGFAVVKMVGELTGKPLKTHGDFIGVIARRA